MNTRVQRLLHDSLIASAAVHPTKTAVSSEVGDATYDELRGSAAGLAAALRSEGLEQGDRVALFMENSLDAAAAIYGTLLAGGVFVSVNHQTKADRLAFILGDSGATFLVAEGWLTPIAAEACERAASATRLVCARPPQSLSFEHLDLHAMTGCGQEPPPTTTTPTDLAALLYTSGSTGTPKGVMHTHQGLLFVTESIAEYLRLSADDRILSVLSMAFGYGLSQLLVAARVGATLLLERSFAYPARTLNRVEEEEATVLPAIPTMLSTLAALFGDAGKCYPSVRTITNAAAALPPALHDPIRRLFPNSRLFRMYGQTECIRVCYLDPSVVERKPTSVGKAIPGTDALVLDAEGHPTAPGEVGTLHVRGPHVMPGYWNAPELTALMIKEGAHPADRVLCTHDLFTVDSEGDLYFVSRTDEIIKTRGEKVSPAQVEEVLFSIDGIQEAAVVGVPDDLLGEAIWAYVVRRTEAPLQEVDILRLCRERLESFAVPHEVRFVEDLPKSPSGKVLRRELR